MFAKKRQYLFKFKNIFGKEKYVTVKADCEADAAWKFINNCPYLLADSGIEYELIGEITVI